MEENKFKGTPGKLELKFVSKICIGIGTVGNLAEITANTILPDSEKQYLKEKIEIEANMQLYASAPDLLECLMDLNTVLDSYWNNLKAPFPEKEICEVQKKCFVAVNKALGKI